MGPSSGDDDPEQGAIEDVIIMILVIIFFILCAFFTVVATLWVIWVFSSNALLDEEQALIPDSDEKGRSYSTLPQSTFSRSLSSALRQTPARRIVETASDTLSSASSIYATPQSIPSSFDDAATHLSDVSLAIDRQQQNGPIAAQEEYTSRIQASGLLLSITEELNWSGKGMHVNFQNAEPLPLRVLYPIEISRSKVEAVACKRIRLCRKSRQCHKHFTIEEALEEVRHMQHLKYSHVIRLVGSYFQNRQLSILSYPVADQDLRQLMQNAKQHMDNSTTSATALRAMFRNLFPCLSSAVQYIHSCNVKHMDLKPQNILICGVHSGSLTITNLEDVRVYITDFGISRRLDADTGDSQTDGLTRRTEMYCSPEVADQQPRGRATDIFSLGCVFAEIETCIASESLENFCLFRTDEGPSFHHNLGLVAEWMAGLPINSAEPAEVVGYRRNTIMAALERAPEKRPTATELSERFPPRPCCSQGLVQFEAMRD